MPKSVVEGFESDPVIQYSVFIENKVGRLNDCTRLLARNNIHILALTILDTTDSSIVRMVVDDPDNARTVLNLQGYSFNERVILVVELDSVIDVPKLLSTILSAEINVDYIYPLIARPGGKSALAIHLEDMDIAADVLRHQNFKVLGQCELSR